MTFSCDSDISRARIIAFYFFKFHFSESPTWSQGVQWFRWAARGSGSGWFFFSKKKQIFFKNLIIPSFLFSNIINENEFIRIFNFSIFKKQKNAVSKFSKFFFSKFLKFNEVAVKFMCISEKKMIWEALKKFSENLQARFSDPGSVLNS